MQRVWGKEKFEVKAAVFDVRADQDLHAANGLWIPASQSDAEEEEVPHRQLHPWLIQHLLSLTKGAAALHCGRVAQEQARSHVLLKIAQRLHVYVHIHIHIHKCVHESA